MKVKDLQEHLRKLHLNPELPLITEYHSDFHDVTMLPGFVTVLKSRSTGRYLQYDSNQWVNDKPEENGYDVIQALLI